MTKCQLMPWLKANHRHHTHYTHGPWYEPPYIMGWDILNLSPRAHRLIHFPYGRVRHQNAWAKGISQSFPPRFQPLILWSLKYPNPGQRFWHGVARVNWLLSKF